MEPFNPDNPIPDHVRRMASETQDVVKRLRNLEGFLETKTFKALTILDQALMFDQKNQMTEYAKTLSLRYCMALLDHS